MSNPYEPATTQDDSGAGWADDVARIHSRQKLLLSAFVVFSVAAFVIAIVMLFSNRIAERLLPYYGWPIIGFMYAAALKYAIPPLLKQSPIPTLQCLRAISTNLLILVGYGILTTMLGWIGDDFGNPYLTVALLQPIWTVLVPLGWFAIFRYEMKRIRFVGTDEPWEATNQT